MAQITMSSIADVCGDAAGDFYTAGVLYMGNDPSLGNSHRQFGWIGFTVNLPQGRKIISATLRVVSTQSRSDEINMHIGCEAADNPSVPTFADDVRTRTLTSAYNDYTPPDTWWYAGTSYDIDVTDAVQEVLNRSGWDYNNTLAVYYASQNIGTDGRRVIASKENSTYTEPQLIITYDSFVSQVIGPI